MDQPKPPKIRREEGTQISSFLLLRDENAKIHRTEVYRTSQVVLRRGFDFLAQFQLSDEFNPDEHSLEVHFRRGSRPAYSRETHFVSRIGRKPTRSYQWPGSTLKTNREVVKVAVKTPVDVPVGEYEVEAEVCHDGASSKFVCQETVVFLFNPWHEDDEVYLDKEEARQEYVMNGMGLIWAGTYKNMFTWPWEYAQFESSTLNAALLLLDLRELVSSERQTAVKVARAAAGMVNYNDDEGGILWGNWSDDYSDGTSPTSWSGSGAILEQYWRTREAVKYAQCWVFGGTLTSVLRCLGIPTRPVTNFLSAHDTDANRAIDFYYDTKGVNLLEDISSDSIWNYHVWVEAWMERPDLKGHYGGWQVLDATPQEPSPHSNKYTLGPAPLSAIKDGISLKYDCEFVISEVNADIKFHVRQKDGTFKDAGSDTRQVGKKISTKAVESEDREDITDHYKYAEGSLKERISLQSGAVEDDSETSGIQVDIESSSDVMIGSPMEATVLVKSTAGDKRFVELTVQVHAVSYIGALGKQVYSKRSVEAVAAGDVLEIPITVAPSDYTPALKDQFLLNITVFAHEETTDFSYVARDTFRFKTPDLDIVIGDGSSSKAAAGNKTTITATFTNLLPVPLTKVQWFVEGAGLTEPLKIVGSDIAIGREGEVRFTITPVDTSLRYRTLVVTCDSKELPAVMGKARVYIH